MGGKLTYRWIINQRIRNQRDWDLYWNYFGKGDRGILVRKYSETTKFLEIHSEF